MPKFTELLLQEAYKIETAEDYINAIRDNNFGVKIPQFLRDQVSVDDEDTINRLKNGVENIIKELDNHGIKKVQGLQALTCLLTIEFSIEYISDKIDGIEETYEEDGLDSLWLCLKYWNADWMSEKEDGGHSIKEKLLDAKKNEKLDLAYLADLSDDIYDKVYSHGSNSKGAGNWQDVLMLYPRRVWGDKEKINPWEADEEGWQLFVPQSFDGERAIAWYGTDPKNMKPTEWCTRARIQYYRTYTRGGDGYSRTVLYVIRNLKTGHAWQCAIQQDDFDFLNEHDKPDRFTDGDLSIFPDELLKLVKDDFVSEYGFGTDARSLYDYKVYQDTVEDDPEYEDNPNYVREPFVPNDVNCKAKPAFGDPIDISNFGLSEEDINKYRIKVCPILNAVGEIANDDEDDLCLREFFAHDYEYGYEHRSYEDGGHDNMFKATKYGRRGGKFWRVFASATDVDGSFVNVYQDCGLYKGQHVYGGIKNTQTRESVEYKSFADRLWQLFNTVTNKLTGQDKRNSRDSVLTAQRIEITDKFNNETMAYVEKNMPILNASLREHPFTYDGDTYYVQYQKPSYSSLGHINFKIGSSVVIRNIEFATDLPINITDIKEQKEPFFGSIDFTRNGNDVERWKMLTDVDTLDAEIFSNKHRTEIGKLDREAVKILYNFMLGYYRVARKSINGYLTESIDNNFCKEIFYESLGLGNVYNALKAITDLNNSKMKLTEGSSLSSPDKEKARFEDMLDNVHNAFGKLNDRVSNQNEAIVQDRFENAEELLIDLVEQQYKMASDAKADNYGDVVQECGKALKDFIEITLKDIVDNSDITLYHINGEEVKAQDFTIPFYMKLATKCKGIDFKSLLVA